jgi:hypothetical protein
VDIEITPSVSFEFGQERNITIDAKSYGNVTDEVHLGYSKKAFVTGLGLIVGKHIDTGDGHVVLYQ